MFAGIKAKLKKWNHSLPGIGLHYYDFESSNERSRVHLRIDPDQRGLLIVNASRIMHLNPTASLMAYMLLENYDHDKAIKIITDKYKVKKTQADKDYQDFLIQLNELVKPDGACPIHDLNLEISPPFTVKPSAPYRMDLAITYRCNNDCLHCYNARSREYPELSTEDWYRILDQLWEIGIPHIVFTGGEPTLRDDLPQLISHAEKNGQITGINTNGRILSNKKYVDGLVEAGLDHVQITLESHDAEIHDKMVNSPGSWKQTVKGIMNVLETSLYVMTNTTMLTSNSPSINRTLEFLAQIGVPTVGLNALIYSGRGRTVASGLAESELSEILRSAREITSAQGQRLIWYTPTQYCNFDPMQLELGVKGCTAALYNMCIESNGDVIPCQSYYQSLGNILSTSWDKVWNHEIAVQIRERTHIPEKCNQCALVKECGGGCPLTTVHN